MWQAAVGNTYDGYRQVSGTPTGADETPSLRSATPGQDVAEVAASLFK